MYAWKAEGHIPVEQGRENRCGRLAHVVMPRAVASTRALIQL